MSITRQQYKENKSELIKQALPRGTVLRSGTREYKVVEVLGAGGFGITYKVISKIKVGNVYLSVYFVIKEFFLKGCWRDGNKTNVLHAPTMETDVKQSHKDFIVEANRLHTIGQLTPNIVKVNEVFEANGTAYYVMEYLDGGDLRHYVNKHGPLPEEEALRLIVTIAKAVALLHDHLLLHLDIKPDNIVLKTDQETKQQIPVLIDFGLAKHFSKSGKPTSHLVAKGASEGYAPMEQYSEIDHFAPEIDVYALGATLYYLLTGKHPPKAFDIHSFNTLKSNLPPELNEATVTALEAAMQPSKFERTSNVHLFIKDLEGVLRFFIKEQSTGKETDPIKPNEHRDDDPNIWRYLITFLAVACLGFFFFRPNDNENEEANTEDEGIQVIIGPGDTLTFESNAEYEAYQDSIEMIIDEPSNTSTTKSTSVSSETKKEEETDELKYYKAVSSGDVLALEELASKGYTKAYAQLASLYFTDRKYDNAANYALKAYKAGVGSEEAIEVMKKLKALGYYDDKELPDVLK